jgi:hypothetical protein
VGEEGEQRRQRKRKRAVEEEGTKRETGSGIKRQA